MKRALVENTFFPFLVVFAILLGLSCAGDNPPFAPFGSTVEIIDPPGDIFIPREAITTIRVQAIVLDPDELPLNDVRVVWELSFAGRNDRTIDTDGDGVADARSLQLVDPDACGELRCDLVDISLWKDFGAFVDSPFTTLSDERGIADVIILINGESVVDPATLEVSLENGAVDVINFGVNVP
jgi:hypothetical protein